MDNSRQFNEEEIVELIYEKIKVQWHLFPNVWNLCTKDDIASDTIIDLYRKRKVDGVSHIQHYFETKGDRNLGSLISLCVYRNFQTYARRKYSGGAARNETWKAVENALSLDASYTDDGESTLESIIPDRNTNVEQAVDYIMLYDSLPDKILDGVYIEENGKYKLVSYKTLLNALLDGYKINQLATKLYKQSEKGFKPCDNVYTLISNMKKEFKEFLISNDLVSREYLVGGKR